jgi:His/Glu/Gln/Arg/opine family amino acid ABC transporter permease subunit
MALAVIEFLRGYEGYFDEWIVEMSLASLGTLRLMVVAFCLACAIGLVIALLRISPLAPLRGFARLYIGFFRGVPVLVILYWIYFALPETGYRAAGHLVLHRSGARARHSRRRLPRRDLPFGY